MKKLILVPTDFTAVGQAALDYALSISEQQNFNICLLHVVDHLSKIAKAENKLDAIAKKQASSYRLKTLVAVGSIFEEIAFVAEEIDASMVVMGTHGLKGFQYITGSNALKVIAKSTCPFIVVQEGNKAIELNNILFPVDTNKFTRLKAKETILLAQLFQSKISLVAPKTRDVFQKKTLHDNLLWLKKEFNKNHVPYTVNYLEGKSFVNELCDFAERENAGLIAMVNNQSAKLTGFLTALNEEQRILENPLNLPVLTVNISPKILDKMSLSSFAGVS